MLWWRSEIVGLWSSTTPPQDHYDINIVSPLFIFVIVLQGCGGCGGCGGVFKVS